MAIELPDGRCESNQVLDALRLRVIHARELGYAVVDLAAILGVLQETISRWCSRHDQGGQEWADENQPDVSKGVPSSFVSLFDSFLAVFGFLADG